MFIACLNPLYSVYFISCSIPTPFLFIFMSRSDMFLGVDSMTSKSSAYYEFFVQELIIITDFSLAVSYHFHQLVT